jgi:hypothetical protein
MPINGVDGEKILFAWLGQTASTTLQTLLETKHLYQSVEVIGLGAKVKELTEQMMNTDNKERFVKWAKLELPKERFVLSEGPLTLVPRGGVDPAYSRPVLTLEPPHASLFCAKCQRREAFVPIWFQDTSIGPDRILMPDGMQTWLISYKCQRCRGVPENFLIRRDVWKLNLHGRSPMEEIEVPAYIPKDERDFYRDAVIAFNSGKTLAALFYLRTFIEQFARRITTIPGQSTGAEIFTAYSATLPAQHRGSMPSLGRSYDKLSAALHSANADNALFETEKREIEHHFDIRRVHEM